MTTVSQDRPAAAEPRRRRLIDLNTPWFRLLIFFRRQYGEPWLEATLSHGMRIGFSWRRSWWLYGLTWEPEPTGAARRWSVAEQPATEVSGQRDRLTLARSCLNNAAYLLRQVESDMSLFDGGEAAELHGIARDCAEKAEAGRDGIRRLLGEVVGSDPPNWGDPGGALEGPRG